MNILNFGRKKFYNIGPWNVGTGRRILPSVGSHPPTDRREAETAVVTADPHPI